MPPAITASPHRATPSRAYCTAPTSRSPRPFPFLGCGRPRRKNCSLTVGFTEYNYLTDFERFGLGGKIRCNDADSCATVRPRVRHIYLAAPLHAPAGSKVQTGLSPRLSPHLVGLV